MTEVVIF